MLLHERYTNYAQIIISLKIYSAEKKIKLTGKC